MSDSLSRSPGEAVAARQRRETDLLREVNAAMAEFLTSLGADAVTASVWFPNLTPGSVRAAWHRLTQRVGRKVHSFFDAPDRPMSQMYLQRLPQRLEAAHVPDDVYDAITQSLSDSARHSESRDKTLRRVRDSLVDQRDSAALRIARTEATASYNFQELDYLAWEGYTGKVWVPVLDAHTRDSHRAASGQAQKLADPFMVGGELLMVPGDPMGSPAQIANCRCVVTGVDQKRRTRR